MSGEAFPQRLASMEPRSGDRGNTRDAKLTERLIELQWSRDLEIAEISAARADSPASAQLQWSRDLEIAEMQLSGLIKRGLPCFNGAAIWRSRKCRPAAHTGTASAALQWSRDLEIAEMSLGGQGALPPLNGFNGAAIWRSRKYVQPVHGRRARSASMEPRSGDRGNHGYTAGGRECSTLQWSRDLEIAEM